MTCRFVIGANGKLICARHDQSLLYVYFDEDGIRILCQVMEDIEHLAKKRSEQKP